MKKAKVDWKKFSRKEKWEYIWDYYKIHIIVGVLVLCFGTYMGVKLATYRAPLMKVIMLNSQRQAYDTQPIFEEFLTENEYEVYSKAIMCHTNFQFWALESDESSAFQSAQYENSQMLQGYYALLYTQEYSVVFGNGWVFEDTLNDMAFMDLRELLPEETLELYEDYIVYYSDEETGIEYPCAITLTEENSWLQEHGLYKNCMVGVLKSAPDVQMASELLGYVLAYNLSPLMEENP